MYRRDCIKSGNVECNSLPSATHASLWFDEKVINCKSWVEERHRDDLWMDISNMQVRILPRRLLNTYDWRDFRTESYEISITFNRSCLGNQEVLGGITEGGGRNAELQNYLQNNCMPDPALANSLILSMKLNSKNVDIDLCPASKNCDYKEHCTLSSVHNNCSMFRRLVLEKLGMTDFPVLANLEEYKMRAFPLKN